MSGLKSPHLRHSLMSGLPPFQNTPQKDITAGTTCQKLMRCINLTSAEALGLRNFRCLVVRL